MLQYTALPLYEKGEDGTEPNSAVATVNNLLTRIKVPITIQSLAECVPALWVALFEGLFETRIPGIIRTDSATTQGARVHNVQLVLIELGGTVLDMDLGHLNAEALVNGNISQMLDLIDIFGEIGNTLDSLEDENEIDLSTGADMSRSRERTREGHHTERRSSNQQLGGEDPSYLFHPADALRQSSPDPGDLSSISRDADSVTFSWDGPSQSNEGTPEEDLSRSSSPTRGTATKRRRDGHGGREKPEMKDDIAEFLANRARSGRSGDTTTTNNMTGSGVNTAERRIRFDLQETPPVLRVRSSDTPHTKALKIRRARIIREMNEIERSQTPRRRPPRSTASSYLSPRTRGSPYHLAYKSHLKAKAKRKDEWIIVPKKTRPPSPVESDSARSDNTTERQDREGDDHSYESGTDEFVQVKTIAESNLDELERVTAEALPGVQIPEHIKQRVWNDLLGSWKRALDDRVWRGTVAQQQAKMSAEDPKPLQQLQKEVNQSMRMVSFYDLLVYVGIQIVYTNGTMQNRHKQETAARQTFKTDLAERQRRIIRLKQDRKAAEDEVKRVLEKRRLRDEQLVQKMYAGFVAEQRQAIIEERRKEKEERKSRADAARVRMEAEENFYRDQVKLLTEQLEEAKRNERIAAKARVEEMRKANREQKQTAKEKIRKFKEKLDVDAEDVVFRERDAARGREGLRIVAVRKWK
ncbi:Centrosomal protein of 95 kDa [Rhizophlyctis rosea]|nr:Centrosomal protein of 95 kDa [Rhizophlyctis rosea]